MVSRDDRRVVALATRRSKGQVRTIVRRSFAHRVAEALDEPAEKRANTVVEKPVPRIRPASARIRRTLPEREARPRTLPERGPRPGARTTSPRQRWVVGLLVLALLGALAAAGVFGRQWYGQRQLDAARRQALAAARQETVDFVSISAATIDEDLKRIADGATGEFRDEFTRDMPQVRAAVLENKVRSNGTVLRAAVVSASTRAAVVLVALDATVKNTNAPDGRLSHYRIQVSLNRDRASGRWLVSQLQFVG
jgi:Mce-associated membrane protein